MKYLIAALTMTIAFTEPAVAAQIETMNKMTPVRLRTFIEQMTVKTKPGGSLDDQAVEEYLNAHLADDGKYSSNITYKIEGLPDQTHTFKADKQKFIDNVIDGRNVMQNYSSSVTVRTVDVSRDNKSAKLDILTRERGEMPIGGENYVPFTGRSECTQQLRLDRDVPKIVTAECTSVLEFKAE